MNKLLISELIKDFKEFELLNNVELKSRCIENNEISRPGIELNGYFEDYEPKRIQLLGKQESNFLKKEMDPENLKRFLDSSVPVIIFSRGYIPTTQFLNEATKKGIPICTSKKVTSKLFSELYEYIVYNLAPETRVHGVALSIYGVGVLIEGASGIGKSEVALELIKRGHFLIADDSVIVKKIDSDTLLGSAPELLKNQMEIRGIGIVDIQKLYGVTSVQIESEIDFIIELTDEKMTEERIGNDTVYEEILEVPVPKIFLSNKTGKNLSNLVEVAVADYQLKNDYNFNSSEVFIQKLDGILKRKT